MIETFERRIEAGYVLTIIPKPLILPLLGFALLAAMATSPGTVLEDRVVMGVAAVWLGWYILKSWANYRTFLVRKSMAKGKELKVIPMMAPRKKALLGGVRTSVYADTFGWKTVGAIQSRHNDTVAEYFIHHDGAVSIAFTWDGVHDFYMSAQELANEHTRRIGLLTALGEAGFVIEQHLLRAKDVSLVDAYEAVGRVMFREKPLPPIIGDLRRGIADVARKHGMNNRVLTVISLNPAEGGLVDGADFLSLLSVALPVIGRRIKRQSDGAAQLMEVWRSIGGYFPGAILCDGEAYQQWIQKVRSPLDPVHGIEWRFALNGQLIHQKPSWNADLKCLELGGTFIKVMLLQNYPELESGWMRPILASNCHLHVCFLMRPKRAQKVLDKGNETAEFEGGTASGRHSNAFLGARIAEIKGFASYVAQHKLPVLDNAFIVTYYSKDAGQIERFSSVFKDMIRDKKGIVVDHEDVQRDMYRVRLPGLGRNTLFWREDHGDTVAAMMPLTTFPTGADRPEVLRIAMTGQLVGLCPSQQTVPHKMVVAMTEGGKDTQEGITIGETYTEIRYDIIELLNSYQGLIEAIGGRYCRADEQAINPLMSYEDFAGSVRFAQSEQHMKVAQVLDAQRTILAPIFKGIKGPDFNDIEKVVMDDVLKWLYQKPVAGKAAPTLPVLLEALNEVPLEKERYEQARNDLGERLYDFMRRGIGERFKGEDQFAISPVANAIDFQGFQGDMADYFMMFLCARLANNAFARGARSQIILNEYAVLLERSPDMVRWITLTIDRMGRKDWVGLTRITQNFEEIQSVDKGALNSIPNRTLLYRVNEHRDIGKAVQMPDGMIGQWENFRPPKELKALRYREAIVCENDEWHHLLLQFPEIGLKLMNTDGNSKPFREIAYKATRDPYERIAMVDRLAQEARAKKERDYSYEKNSA